MAACLRAVQGGERVHVAVVTFDATVHFFSLRAEQSAPQMLVMPDAAQPYCPAANSSLIVPLHESRALVRPVAIHPTEGRLPCPNAPCWCLNFSLSPLPCRCRDVH